MPTSTTIRFTDPHEGDSIAIVKLGVDAIGITLSTHAGSGAEVFMRAADAEKFANAILAAAGAVARPVALPQSRQIGGIIGPY